MVNLHSLVYLLLFSLLVSSDRVYQKRQFIGWVRIGSGAFSNVYRARDTLNGNSLVTIKDVNIKARHGTWGRNHNPLLLNEEIKVLTAMNATDFTRVVHYYGRFDYVSHTYLVMEYCPHGSLYTYLARNGRMSYAAAASVMYQLASAVALLHQKGFAHGDLHSGNVMISAVDTQVKGNICVKLIDFGHSSSYSRIQWLDWDIYDMGDLLNAMLPASYLLDPSPNGVACRRLVSEMRGQAVWGTLQKAQYSSEEVLAHPFVQSGKGHASKWPMYA